mmetsp:Transcript_4678/g.9470  ORF Transcript_4678/g.9470 Transcript_4678/m.9470 type:complete len:150 (+) Transcript_4678:122-571(+)
MVEGEEHEGLMADKAKATATAEPAKATEKADAAKPNLSTEPQVRQRTKKRHIWYNKTVADGMREATDARREFMDTVTLSDLWLIGTVIFFSVLGNVYRIKWHYEFWVGVFLFCCSFGVYLLIKQHEEQQQHDKSSKDPPEEERQTQRSS